MPAQIEYRGADDGAAMLATTTPSRFAEVTILLLRKRVIATLR